MFELLSPKPLIDAIDNLGVYRKVEFVVDIKTAQMKEQLHEEDCLWVIIDRHQNEDKHDFSGSIVARIYLLTQVRNANDTTGARAEEHARALRNALINGLYGQELGAFFEPIQYDRGTFLAKDEHHYFWLDEFTAMQRAEFKISEANLEDLKLITGQTRAKIGAEIDSEVSFH